MDRMHSALSTNMLTQCPAQTCLAVHQKNKYNGGKGLPSLPVRLLKDETATRSTKVGRCQSKDTSRSTTATSTSSSRSSLTSSQSQSQNERVRKVQLFGKGSTKSKRKCGKKSSKETTTATALSSMSSLVSEEAREELLIGTIAPNNSTKSIFPSAQPSKMLETLMDRHHHPNKVGSGDFCGGGGALSEYQHQPRENNYSTASFRDYDFTGRNGSEKVRCIALPLLKQRLGYLWEKSMFTDVVFIVGRNKTKIEAHRVILASASEVFQSLLYKEGKPLIADGKFILYEEDFSEPAFEVFIKAMYTNEIPICLTLPLALEVFYATKKYSVIFLEDQVLEHIRQLLTVSNVFEALRFSTNALELTYLAPICWKIIEEQTKDVLEYHMDDLDAHTFARILERDRLSLEEVELFQMGVRWAANLCKIHGMKTTGKNKRHFMEPLLKHFRFTTMTPSQFTEVVVPSRILEMKEVQQLQAVFNKVIDSRGAQILPYKTNARVNTSIQNLLKVRQECCSNPNCGHYGNPEGQVKEVPKICSDSAVIAPGMGSKLHSKKGSGAKVNRPRRMASHKGR